jgi:hypothetical protein
MECHKRAISRIDPQWSKYLQKPLPVDRVRSLSLENHLALATVRSGYGDLDQLGCLVRVVYLSFYLQGATPLDAEAGLYQRAEEALDACFSRAKRGERYLMLDRELMMIEQILAAHDEQLRETTWYQYLLAWERFRNRIATGRCSPLAAASRT